MTWLRNIASAIAVAGAAFIAILYAKRATSHEQARRKWETKAREQDVDDRVRDANAAISQAKLHEAEAARIRKKAEDKINAVANSDETVRDIVDRWRAE